MSLKLSDTVPDFTQDSTEGLLHFYEWAGDSWVVLFSHPKDFTPVCTTGLGTVARLKPGFDRRGVKVLGLSVDPVGSHEGWAADIEETQGTALNFPLIADLIARSRRYSISFIPTRPIPRPCGPCSSSTRTGSCA